MKVEVLVTYSDREFLSCSSSLPGVFEIRANSL